MKVMCPVSLGEIVDKLSILMIKERNITDQQKLEHIKTEKFELETLIRELKLDGLEEDLQALIEVNSDLWDIEDKIRLKEKEKDFGEEFISLARAVYVTNDKRFEFKNRVNTKFGSQIVEVKSYEKY